MLRKLEGIDPERVFYYFEEISKIPHCSSCEKKISDYLAGIGKQLGLETMQDEALNIIIKKPGTHGYENSPTVILQGHMDMVCEKEEGSNHNFATDPLRLRVEGDFIKAEETTLGGDNGIAVAMALALLESKDIPHPPIEVLITTDEETGMHGANAIDPDCFRGRMLINMDSEEEGTILVSCAGGETNRIRLPIECQPLDGNNKVFYSIKTAGLQGGHSGMEIDKGRGNAIKIIARMLDSLRDEFQYDLVHIECGTKTNAIPRNGSAVIAFEKEEADRVIKIVNALENQIQKELTKSDPDFSIIVESIDEKEASALSKDSLDRIISTLMLIPTGVQSMSLEMEGLVESSVNLAIVNILEKEINIEISIRSSKESLKSNIRAQLRTIAKVVNGKWESHSSYPGWEYAEKSVIREIFKKAYKSQYGKEVNIAAVHAGLECGIFAQKFSNMDMISFGPNLYDVHTPEEKLSIGSTKRTYELLLNVLKEIK